MTNKITGDEPVMPIKENSPIKEDATGLTIRQELAARNMAELLPHMHSTPLEIEMCASIALAGADALIKELNK